MKSQTSNDNRFFSRLFLFAVLATGLFAVSCDNDKDADDDTTTTLAVDTVRNVNAIPAETNGHYAFYSFDEKSLIPSSDSATTRWDIAFRATSVIFNSGASGPGTASVQLIDAIFDNVAELPTAGYKQDAAGQLAITAASNQGWYSYTGPTGTPAHAILPIPGKVFAIKTNKGNYVKMEILSYYRDMPKLEEIDINNGRVYNFRFVLQPNGTPLF